jgi:cardiolipin synthase A/B
MSRIWPMMIVMHSALSLPFFEGEIHDHHLSVIVEGQARFDALRTAIDQAQRRIRLFYYIFVGDAHGGMIRDALIAAAKRGVHVTVLIDGFGSQDLPADFFAELARYNAEIISFIPRFGRRYLLRNHQKMMIIDDDYALIGGANIATDYFSDVQRGGQWHDLMLTIRGGAVLRLGAYHDDLSKWMRGDKRTIRRLQAILRLYSDADGPLRWLMGGPFQRLSPFTRTLRADMQLAYSLDMIQAYFAPDFSFLRLLNRIARTGRLRIVTAAQSDNSTTIGAARHCYPGLLRRGGNVYEYTLAKLHMKLIVVDEVVYIGSANCDTRSLFINVELMLRIEDSPFANTMRRLCAEHHNHSQPVDKHWLKRSSGPFRRLRWFIAYFLVTTVDYTITRRINIGPNRRHWFKIW